MLGYALDMPARECDRGHPGGVDPEPVGARVIGPGVERGSGPIASLARSQLANGAAVSGCERCAETRRTCPSCVQRRRYAWSLMVERGESCETASRIVGLAPERVLELVAAEQDRRELRSLRRDSIPIQRTRSVIAEALARDPDLTIADLARWMEMAQADFERAFLGRGRSGRPKLRVNVASASQLMIALGRAPNELEGC